MNISSSTGTPPPLGGVGASTPRVGSGERPAAPVPSADSGGAPQLERAAPDAGSPPEEPLAAVKMAIEVLNRTIAASRSSVEFQLDEISGRSVVRVVDTQTSELIRQYPTEEFMEISRTVSVLAEGLLLRTEA